MYRSVRVAETMTKTVNEALREAYLNSESEPEDYAALELEWLRVRSYEVELKQSLRVSGLLA